MTKPTSHRDAHEFDDTQRSTCPNWCVAQHAVHLGEEDWIHSGEPVVVADGMAARLCMSIHPTTGVEDGPYVLIGTSELTLDETVRLGEHLLGLARTSGGLLSHC